MCSAVSFEEVSRDLDMTGTNYFGFNWSGYTTAPNQDFIEYPNCGVIGSQDTYAPATFSDSRPFDVLSMEFRSVIAYQSSTVTASRNGVIFKRLVINTATDWVSYDLPGFVGMNTFTITQNVPSNYPSPPYYNYNFRNAIRNIAVKKTLLPSPSPPPLSPSPSPPSSSPPPSS